MAGKQFTQKLVIRSLFVSFSPERDGIPSQQRCERRMHVVGGRVHGRKNGQDRCDGAIVGLRMEHIDLVRVLDSLTVLLSGVCKHLTSGLVATRAWYCIKAWHARLDKYFECCRLGFLEVVTFCGVLKQL